MKDFTRKFLVNLKNELSFRKRDGDELTAVISTQHKSDDPQKFTFPVELSYNKDFNSLVMSTDGGGEDGESGKKYYEERQNDFKDIADDLEIKKKDLSNSLLLLFYKVTKLNSFKIFPGPEYVYKYIIENYVISFTTKTQRNKEITFNNIPLIEYKNTNTNQNQKQNSINYTKPLTIQDETKKISIYNIDSVVFSLGSTTNYSTFTNNTFTLVTFTPKSKIPKNVPSDKSYKLALLLKDAIDKFLSTYKM